VPIDRFIVDFFSSERNLIVEIDGGQHNVNTKHDSNRTAVLEAVGYLVLRFWNHDVMGIDGVLETILSTINQARSGPPHPNPLPSGERERTER
jgi:very-short-patch-repair endonuclease